MSQPKKIIQQFLENKLLSTLVLFFILLAFFIGAQLAVRHFLPHVYQSWHLFQANLCLLVLNAYADAALQLNSTLNIWLLKNGKAMVSIVPACLIDKSLALYLAFLISQRQKLTRLFKFILIGIVFILTFNTLRIIALGELFLWRPSWFNYAHDFLLPATEYLMVFALWVWILKTKNTNQDELN